MLLLSTPHSSLWTCFTISSALGGRKAFGNSSSITDLTVDRGRAVLSDLQAIYVTISNNQRAQARRRVAFLRRVLLLALDSANQHSTSLWVQLPRDLRLCVLRHLCASPMREIGKTSHQAYSCALFLMANARAICERIGSGPDWLLVENQYDACWPGCSSFRLTCARELFALEQTKREVSVLLRARALAPYLRLGCCGD